MNPETIEQAREMLLQNSETIKALNEQIATLKTENGKKDATIEDLRTLNQKYYLKLSQGEDEPEEPDKPQQTLEEYAIENLKGVIKK